MNLPRYEDENYQAEPFIPDYPDEAPTRPDGDSGAAVSTARRDFEAIRREHEHPLAPKTFGERVDEKYTKFRGSWWFVGIFLSYTMVWFVLRHFYHFDPNLDELNTQYSIEATIAGAMISMELNRAEQARKKAATKHDVLLHYIVDLGEKHERLLKYVADVAEAILEATGDSEEKA